LSLARQRATSLASWALWSLRVGVESVGLVWLVVVLATIAVSKAAASLNAAAILSAGDALHTGTALWSLGFGGSTALTSEDDGVLSLPLLGLTLVQAGWTWFCVRRARPSRPAAGADGPRSSGSSGSTGRVVGMGRSAEAQRPQPGAATAGTRVA